MLQSKNIQAVILIVSLLSLLLVLSVRSPVAAVAVNMAGRVFSEAGPIKGAQVYVYRSYEDIGTDKPFFTSDPTDAKGVYGFELAPGEYYFVARGSNGGKSYISYHGSNPINITTENIWLSFMANEKKQPVYSKGHTAIRGTVTYKGEPVPGAHVAIYTMDAKRFKGLGFLSDKGIGFMKAVDTNGAFNFSLPPNRYVVIARKMAGGGEIRPLRKDDLFCYTPANPVEVKAGHTVAVEIPCYPKGDRLAFVSTAKIKTNDYLTMDKFEALKKYGIKGKVTDEKGTPMQGVYVIAYRTQEPSTPTREAENIAQTDAKGNFFIHLNADGNYGLVVRDTLGGAPKVNGVSGLYDREDPWQGVAFKTGKVIENINITVKKEQMMLFAD